MIIRIVKMTFHEEKVPQFLKLFEEVKSKIAGFEGCQNVELLRDIKRANVLFTYSTWDSAEHLEQYRRSPLFESTWNRAKALFAEKSEAWSVEKVNG